MLLADYSCAISSPRPWPCARPSWRPRGAGAGQGGKHLEALARADAIILDKTGTLTQARPSVVDVCPVGDYSREYILRHAACLEEHFPHPVAEAVVRKAEEEGLDHRERHAEVEYILAHGISSTLDGQRVLLGSRHFVHEDEGVDLDPAEASIRRCADSGHTALYMAIGGQLAGVICIEDPIHPTPRASCAAWRTWALSASSCSPATARPAPDAWPGNWALRNTARACCPRTRRPSWTNCAPPG